MKCGEAKSLRPIPPAYIVYPQRSDAFERSK
jgi:hypothetical protein